MTIIGGSLDLRLYGSVPHATYVCGIENIRQAVAFARYAGNAEFLKI